MLIALTRSVSRTFSNCALSFVERRPIDYELACRQHHNYQLALARLGCHVRDLPAEHDLPDAIFVEDTAVVVDELAVMTAPALPERAREVTTVAAALAAYRPLETIGAGGTLEGGDVLRIGRTFYVGLSRRTNQRGIDQLAGFLAPRGYEVVAVEVGDCLHLKTACTYIGRNTLLANSNWVDTGVFSPCEVIEVAGDEVEAGNALSIGETLVLPFSFPKTRQRLERRGFRIEPVDVSEVQKAEGGVTCCSILFSADEHFPPAA